jgi:hypothetical protein
MGKQSKNNNVLFIETMNQSNETNSKLDLNRMYLPESLMTDKPQYKQKNQIIMKKRIFQKKNKIIKLINSQKK